MEFISFQKIGRLARGMVVTEKLDGTNAQVVFDDEGVMWVGSRNRWITPGDDNYGFAKWCAENEDELRKLGPGRHYGEWWGQGIQRGYGLKEKRFSLFNTGRWNAENLPACCSTVPILYSGVFDNAAVEAAIEALREYGSAAAPGFMDPEGVVVFHSATNTLFKKTLKKDESPKSLVIPA